MNLPGGVGEEVRDVEDATTVMVLGVSTNILSGEGRGGEGGIRCDCYGTRGSHPLHHQQVCCVTRA